MASETALQNARRDRDCQPGHSVTPGVILNTNIHVAPPPPAWKRCSRPPGFRNNLRRVPTCCHPVTAINDGTHAGDSVMAACSQNNEEDALRVARTWVEQREKGPRQPAAV